MFDKGVSTTLVNNLSYLNTEPEFWLLFFLKSASPYLFFLVLILLLLLLFLLESALKCHALSYIKQVID